MDSLFNRLAADGRAALRRTVDFWRGRWIAHSLLLAVFVAVHTLYYGLGGVFDADIFSFWQVIDLDLLKHRLLESLWYLHMQPPLFNGFLGLVEKWSFGSAYSVYGAVYLAFGLVAACSLLHLQLRFHIAAPIALGVTSLCLISPSWFLYENWLMYTFPVMALLGLSAVRMHIYLERPTIRNGIWFFGLLAVLVYLRSLFQFGWFVFAAALAWMHLKDRRLDVAKALAVPLALVFLLYLKNWLVFGTWATSTWLGPNLMVMTRLVPPDIRRDLVLKGELSTLSYVHPFYPIESYRGYTQVDPNQTWGVPVLDRMLKSDGDQNRNHGLYLMINRTNLRDACVLIRAAPGYYLQTVAEAWRRFCLPAWNYRYFRGQNPVFLEGMVKWNHWLLGWPEEDFINQLRKIEGDPRLTAFCWLLPALALGGIVLLLLPGHITRFSSVDRIVLLFVLITLLMVTFEGTFCLHRENNRIRFVLTPYFALLVGLLADRMVQAVRRLIGFPTAPAALP
ncbi:MAG: hypothetical protein ACE15F_00040 [bacterium]